MCWILGIATPPISLDTDDFLAVLEYSSERITAARRHYYLWILLSQHQRKVQGWISMRDEMCEGMGIPYAIHAERDFYKLASWFSQTENKRTDLR